MIQIAAAASGRELGYAEITSDFVTASTSAVDVSGLSVTVTVGARPIIVEFGAGRIVHGGSGGYGFFYLMEGATALALGSVIPGTSPDKRPMLLRRRLAPSPGSHTYKVQAYQWEFGAAGGVEIAAAATNPAWLQVTEV